MHSNELVGANFNKCWNHYDVLLKGKLNADMLPNLYRMMAADMNMQLQDGVKDDKEPWITKAFGGD